MRAMSQKVLESTGEKLDSLTQNPSLSVSERAKQDHQQGIRLQLVVRLHDVFANEGIV